MKIITLWILSFFDFFHKKKIINIIRNKITRMDTLIDVGAHHGESVFLFAKSFDASNIYSFEPSLENYKMLLNNVKYLIKKKKINFKSYNLGLGSREQKLFLNIPLETSSSTINSINTKSDYYKKKNMFLGNKNMNFFDKKEEIKILTLDSVMEVENFNAVDLLKIDTEGFEYEVLLGSVEVLKKTKLILFEHHYDNMLLKSYNFGDINNFLVFKH